MALATERGPAPTYFALGRIGAAFSRASSASKRGEPNSLAVRRGAAGARVFGAIDAVAEAHQPLAAVERVRDPPLASPLCSTSSSIGDLSITVVGTDVARQTVIELHRRLLDASDGDTVGAAKRSVQF